MSLLESLGLPKPANLRSPAAKTVAQTAGPKPAATVTVFNGSPTELRLVGTSLTTKTARFDPSPPATLGGGKQFTLRVVEPTLGLAGTAGSIAYEMTGRDPKVTIDFAWGDGDCFVVVSGQGQFSPASQTQQNAETGHRYAMVFREVVGTPATAPKKPGATPGAGGTPTTAPGTKAAWPGATLTFENATPNALVNRLSMLQGTNTRFETDPPDRLEPGAVATFRVVADGPGATSSAGSSLYGVDGKDDKTTVTFDWKGDQAKVLLEGDAPFTSDASATLDPAKGDRYRIAVKGAAPVKPPAAPVRIAKVAVVNKAGFTLRAVRSHLDGQSATFAPEPPAAIAGGSTGVFSVRADDPAHPEIGGFADYELTLDKPDPKNPDGVHTLKLAWSSSEWGASISPHADGLDVEKGGAVHDFVFTVTGPAIAFDPPAKSGGEPTLRSGDKSSDGWVEYLQELLVMHRAGKLEVDGIFGPQTLKAVHAFQRKHKKEGVLDDGVVGDQTWSYLRVGAPKKPATDGRKAHSYTEQGDETRWSLEHGGVYIEPGSPDVLSAWVVSVGNSDTIAGRMARFRIVAPDGREKVLDQPLGKAGPAGKNGQGAWHDAHVHGFATMFDADGPKPGPYKVNAYLPSDLGGDSVEATVEVQPKKP